MRVWTEKSKPFAEKSAVWPLVFILTMLVGLVIDQFVVGYGQLLVSLWTVTLFLILVLCSPKRESIQFCICLCLALFGEFVLSDLGELYIYRERSIPVFVPPGHVLLYCCGLWFAKRATKMLFWY